jgi:hypothetical protein
MRIALRNFRIASLKHFDLLSVDSSVSESVINIALCRNANPWLFNARDTLIEVTLSTENPPFPLKYDRSIPTATAFSYFSHASRHNTLASSGLFLSNTRARSPTAIAQL